MVDVASYVYLKRISPATSGSGEDELPPSCTVVFDLSCMARGTSDVGQAPLMITMMMVSPQAHLLPATPACPVYLGRPLGIYEEWCCGGVHWAQGN